MSNKKSNTAILNYINALLPDNIGIGNKFLNDCLEILTEVIEDYNPHPIPVNIFDNRQKVIPREVILKSFLENYYTSMVNALSNPSIIVKMGQVSNAIGTDKNGIEKFLNDEFLWIGSTLRYTKGRRINIELAYKAIANSGIQANIQEAEFMMNYGKGDPKPFSFSVVGGLMGEVYQATVKNMAHPLGFGFDYTVELKLPMVYDNFFDLKDEFEIAMRSNIKWEDEFNPGKHMIETIGFTSGPQKNTNPEDMLEFQIDDDDFSISVKEPETKKGINLKYEEGLMTNVSLDSDIGILDLGDN